MRPSGANTPLTVQCTYDAGGIRQSKKTQTVTTTYYTEGNTIHKEERSDGKTLWYYYDQSGIAAIEENGTMYYCEKNIQGDIVALLNSSGSVVVRYSYDAWGNHKVYNGIGQEIYDSETGKTMVADHIGNLNPFRYRGYYYDPEWRLYYLETRYYDPSVGRFISSDNIDYADPNTFAGLNLYAYCGNNPIMGVDPMGTSVLLSLLLAGLITGMIVGGIYGGLTAAANKQNVGMGILIGALGGAVMGAAAGVGGYFIAYGTVWAIGLGVVISFFGGFAVGFGMYIWTQYVNRDGTKPLDVWAAALSGLQWGILNILSAFMGSPAGNFVEGLAAGYGIGLIVSGIGLIIDVLKRYFGEDKKEEKIISSGSRRW